MVTMMKKDINSIFTVQCTSIRYNNADDDKLIQKN
jgi:hypothetical protein